MKLLKKNALLLTLLATTAGLAVGCGSQNDSEGGWDKVSERDPIEPTSETIIIWWNNYQVPDNPEDESTRTGSKYREYWYAKDLIAAFETEHPNIKVETVYKGAYAAIAKEAATALSGGNQPNIVSCYGDSVATFRTAVADSVLDMAPYAVSLKNDADYNQNYLDIEKGMYDNGLYSMPYSKSAETLVVNESVFSKVGAGEAGKTVDGKYTAPVAAASKVAYSIPQNIYDVMDVARKMKADFPDLFANQKDDQGYFTAVPFCWDSAENMFISALQNSGIAYTNGAGATAVERVLFNNQDAKNLVIQLKKWNNEGLFATQNQLPITNATKGYHEYSSNMVSQGKIFMAVSSTAGARYFAMDGGYKASFNHMPSWKENGKTAEAKVISQGPSLCFFDKGEVQNDASFIFYKYLTNATNSGKLAANTSYFPLRAEGYNNDTIKAAVAANAAGITLDASYSDKCNAYTGAVLALNETYSSENNYFLSPVFEESAATRTAVGNLITTVFNDHTATTDADIKTLVDNAFKSAAASVLA